MYGFVPPALPSYPLVVTIGGLGVVGRERGDGVLTESGVSECV